MRCFLLCLLFTGCSLYYPHDDPPPDDPPPDDPPVFPNCPSKTYAVPSTVTAADELEAKIEATSEWTAFGEYTTGCLYASEDITIAGAITLDGANIATPPLCSDCPTGAEFVLRDAPVGVTCIGAEYWWDFTTCDAIELADTTIRLRTLRRDIHPAYPNYLHIIEVLPPSETPCGAEQYTCSTTRACWSSARDYCAYCLDGDNEQCACWEGTQFMSDGAQCHFMVSGDVQLSGTCEAGVCERNE